MYWTSVSKTGRQQTRRVVSRPIRRAPPSALRPAATQTQNRQALIGFLWVTGVIFGIALVVITYGIALIPIVFGIWWWIRRMHRQPKYIAAQLMHRAAAASPREAVHLYHQAIDANPTGIENLRAAGDWFFQQSCWSDAADSYAGYLHLANNPEVEHNYATSLVEAGHLDEAIQEFQSLASSYEQVPVSLISGLAGAFLLKGDPGQALAIAKQAPLQKHELDEALQKALLARAYAQYMLGQKAKAFADLERLYAVNPNFPQVAEIKQRMSAGTFQIDVPQDRPAWYPAEVELLEGPAVEEVPDGHVDQLAPGTLSPDGSWSWSGNQWIPGSDSQPMSAAAEATVSSGSTPLNVLAIPTPHATRAASISTVAESPPAGPVLEDPQTVSSSVPTIATPPTLSVADPPAKFSADRNWWWNGKEWVSAISDDGRQRWDGTRWMPAE